MYVCTQACNIIPCNVHIHRVIQNHYEMMFYFLTVEVPSIDKVLSAFINFLFMYVRTYISTIQQVHDNNIGAPSVPLISMIMATFNIMCGNNTDNNVWSETLLCVCCLQFA